MDRIGQPFPLAYSKRTMNVLLIDLEAIYQKAIENVRYIDAVKLIKRWTKICEAKEVAVFANLSKRHVKHIAEDLVALKKRFAKDEIELKIFDGYSEVEHKSFSDLVLVNYLYKSFFKQNTPRDNNYFIAASDSRYFNLAKDLQEIHDGNQFGLIMPDKLTYDIPEIFKSVDEIKINSPITLVEKLVIQESIRNIMYGEKNKQPYTIKNIVQQNLQNSKIPYSESFFVIASLLERGVVRRAISKMVTSEGETTHYLVLRMGTKKKVNTFLKKNAIELK